MDAASATRIPAAPPGGWGIATLSGVPIRVGPSALAAAAIAFAAWIPVFATVPAAGGSPWGGAALSTLVYAGFLLSLLGHEFAHVLVARRYGMGCHWIHLSFLGMFAALEREARSPGEDAAIALAGPAFSLALAASCWALAGLPGLAGFLMAAMVYVNLTIAAFNLVPCFPMDGGRAVRAAAWAWTGDLRRGTVAAARVGWVGAGILVAYGAHLLTQGILTGAVPILIALAMLAYTRARLADLRREAVTAGGLMRPFGAARDDGDVALSLAPSEPGGEAGVELWVGRDRRRVGALPLSGFRTVPPGASLADMMAAFSATPAAAWPVLIVVERGPVGYVTQGGVVGALDGPGRAGPSRRDPSLP